MGFGSSAQVPLDLKIVWFFTGQCKTGLVQASDAGLHVLALLQDISLYLQPRIDRSPSLQSLLPPHEPQSLCLSPQLHVLLNFPRTRPQLPFHVTFGFAFDVPRSHNPEKLKPLMKPSEARCRLGTAHARQSSMMILKLLQDHLGLYLLAVRHHRAVLRLHVGSIYTLWVPM